MSRRKNKKLTHFYYTYGQRRGVDKRQTPELRILKVTKAQVLWENQRNYASHNVCSATL